MRTPDKRLAHRDVRLGNILVHDIDSGLPDKRERLRHRLRRLGRRDLPARKEFLQLRHCGIAVHVTGKRKHDTARGIDAFGKALHVGHRNLLVLVGGGVPKPCVRCVVHLRLEGRQNLRRSIVTAFIGRDVIRLHNLELVLVERRGGQDLLRKLEHRRIILRQAVDAERSEERPRTCRKRGTDKFEGIIQGVRGHSPAGATAEHRADHLGGSFVLHRRREVRFFEKDRQVHQRQTAVTHDVARNPIRNFHAVVRRNRRHIAELGEHDILVACRDRRRLGNRLCGRFCHRYGLSGSFRFRNRRRRTGGKHATQEDR